jgi:hypothetical protein
MLRPIIYPYNLYSESAKALSESLSDRKCKRVRENGNYSHYDNHLIVNWGNSRFPNWWNENVYIVNNPKSVAKAQNKLVAFKLMHDKVRNHVRRYGLRTRGLQWLGHYCVVVVDVVSN